MSQSSKKNIPFTLIFSVIIGLLIIGGAVFYAQHQAGQGDASSSAKVTYKHSSKEKVDIPERMTSCSSTEQGSCIIVETRCDFCCDYVAINSADEREFDSMFDQHCGNFNGKKCECFDLSSYPACINKKCQMVEW